MLSKQVPTRHEKIGMTFAHFVNISTRIPNSGWHTPKTTSKSSLVGTINLRSARLGNPNPYSQKREQLEAFPY